MQDVNLDLEPYLDRIVQAFEPLRIILFGSHGRGEAHMESDVDLLVVIDDETINKREAAIQMRRLLKDAPFPKDIIVTTPGEIGRRGSMIGSILRPALREGRVVYDRS